MRRTVLSGIILVASLSTGHAQSFNDSPYNFKNSEYNFENSPYNFRNSPYNFNNSPYNFNSRNGVYDDDGERTGYAVRRPDGGTNFFNDDGDRTGYMPGSDD